jgi:HEAT repeat protein
MTILFVPFASAQTEQFTAEKKSAVVDNLTVGINSSNNGLRTSSANVMYDLIDENYLQSNDASKSMIPLLNMLENGETEEVRIAAAVALFKLGNGIGIYRLRGVAKYDKNPRVSGVCKNLYYSYHKLNGTEYLINF